tara:strand:+ start:6489 stop:6701 length:213 start_codon:yes stop_codon:yes gene_type:complete
MAKEPNYTKDIYTGAVVFHDANEYAKRKKLIEKQKIDKAVVKDSRRVINSMKNEIKGLKQIVYDLVESGK